MTTATKTGNQQQQAMFALTKAAHKKFRFFAQLRQNEIRQASFGVTHHQAFIKGQAQHSAGGSDVPIQRCYCWHAQRQNSWHPKQGSRTVTCASCQTWQLNSPKHPPWMAMIVIPAVSHQLLLSLVATHELFRIGLDLGGLVDIGSNVPCCNSKTVQQ